MKTPLLFSMKQSVLSRVFALAIIVSVIVPNTFFVSVRSASAQEATVSTSESTDAVSESTSAVSENSSEGATNDETTPSSSDEADKTVISTPSTTDSPIIEESAKNDPTSSDVLTTTVSTETIATDSETTVATQEVDAVPAAGSDEPRAASSAGASNVGAAPTGSVTICKVIEDNNGHIVTGPRSNIPPSEFKIQLSSRPNPSNVIGTATFNTETFATTWPALSPLDAQCQTFNNLPLGGYIYGQEVISGEGATYWYAPKYNDQLNRPADRFSNFWTYSNELFDTDTTNDRSRNEDADGVVTINREQPNRVVVVLNQMASPYGTRGTGSVTICKAIQDNEGHLVTSTSTNLPPAEFKVQLFSRISPPAVVQDATFNTSTFTATTSASAPLASECVTYDNLPLGSYIYEQERITGAGASYWTAPKYNDQLNVSANMLSDFWPYSGELFDTDETNDGQRNENADGIVTINEERTSRTVYVLNTFNEYVPPAPCANGTELSPLEFHDATNNGLINFSLQTLDASSTTATFTITNNTGCTAPISLSSYRVFDPSQKGTTTSFFLSRQVLFDHTDLVHASSSVTLTVDLPSCMAQVDAWYGRGPGRLMDSNPYVYPHVPHVLAYQFYFPTANQWGDLPASYCQNPAENTPPTITLVGENPLSITVGNNFTDPGATAIDLEDGDLTSAIVATGTVDTNVVGSYTRTYSVTDSGGLSASVTRTVNVVTGGGGTPGDNGDDNNGGGGRRHGSSGGSRARTTGEVLGAAVEPGSCEYLRDYLRQDWNNDTAEVLKLQFFLKNLEGHSELETNGVFDAATFAAVSGFQEKYFDDILKPWGHDHSTGFVYILTKKKVNEIFCNKAFPLTDLQEKEISDFKNLLKDLKAADIDVMTGSGDSMNMSNMVGLISSTSTSTVALYTGPENENKIDTKNIRAVAAAIFSIPSNREEVLQSLYFFLIAIIAIYLLTEIAVGSRDTSNLSKYQVWSRKATGYILGLIIAAVIAIWYQIFSIVVPFLVLAIASGVFLVWTISKKRADSVIQLPPSNQ